MSEELEDEIVSINSIYGEGTLEKIPGESTTYSLTLPSQREISLRIEFPLHYPFVPPAVLGTQAVGDKVPKGEGSYLVEVVRDVLATVYTPGAACIFDLAEEVGSHLQQFARDTGPKYEEPQLDQADGQQYASLTEAECLSDGEQSICGAGEEPHWTLSEVVTEKKSIFIARAASVTTTEQAKRFLAHLLVTDKKVAKATHNITAWRIRGENGIQFQDCDDDGETAAGGRLLHLLELVDVWNAMVIVTRWYGGIQLGPDRFRIISSTAKDALVKGEFVQDSGKGKKKRGK